MKSSISDLKKILETQKTKELIEIVLRIAKYKRENKELLDYILNFSQEEENYINSVKAEIEVMLIGISSQHVKNQLKIIRKTLKIAKKHIKFSNKKETEIEILIHFCKNIKKQNLKIMDYPVMQNLYDRQILKINSNIEKLHPDLQFDYTELMNGF